jgi:HSP20 family protein
MKPIKRNGNSLPVRTMFTDLLNADRFFNSEFFNLPSVFTADDPPANIKDEDKQFLVEMSAPGFDKKDFTINVENDILTISAEKQEEKNETKEDYSRKEFSYNSFERSFVLPQAVLEDDIKAEYKNGILNLVIPKKEISEKKNKKQIAVS